MSTAPLVWNCAARPTLSHTSNGDWRGEQWRLERRALESPVAGGNQPRKFRRGAYSGAGSRTIESLDGLLITRPFCSSIILVLLLEPGVDPVENVLDFTSCFYDSVAKIQYVKDLTRISVVAAYPE